MVHVTTACNVMVSYTEHCAAILCKHDVTATLLVGKQLSALQMPLHDAPTPPIISIYAGQVP